MRKSKKLMAEAGFPDGRDAKTIGELSEKYGATFLLSTPTFAATYALEAASALIGLAGIAGLLTTLSPCVLPILPMVAASATGRSRWGLPAPQTPRP